MTLENIRLLACMPIDRSSLPQLKELDDIVITDLYQRDNCRMCRQAIWVGPRQWAVYQLDTQLATLLCYLCAIRVGGDLEVHELGGGHQREGVPRV